MRKRRLRLLVASAKGEFSLALLFCVRYHGFINAAKHRTCKNDLFSNGEVVATASEFELDRRLTILETRFDTMLPTLATKADLSELKAELKAEMRSGSERLSKWMATLTISLIIGFGGMLLTMFTVLRP